LPRFVQSIELNLFTPLTKVLVDGVFIKIDYLDPDIMMAVVAINPGDGCTISTCGNNPSGENTNNGRC
jgi:hypothetical protein